MNWDEREGCPDSLQMARAERRLLAAQRILFDLVRRKANRAERLREVRQLRGLVKERLLTLTERVRTVRNLKEMMPPGLPDREVLLGRS